MNGIKTTAVILFIGIVGIIAAISTIYFDLPKTEPAKFLTIFLFLSSIAVVAVSLIGMWMQHLVHKVMEKQCKYNKEYKK